MNCAQLSFLDTVGARDTRLRMSGRVGSEELVHQRRKKKKKRRGDEGVVRGIRDMDELNTRLSLEGVARLPGKGLPAWEDERLE